jgi:hypothetical protein
MVANTLPKLLSSTFVAVLAALGCAPAFSQQATSKQTQPTVHLGDNSDWWSLTKENASDEAIEFQERDLPRSNFRILEIDLGNGLLDRAMQKLGVATTVERGDASTGRHQLCYVSSGQALKTYVIFETGEVNDAFYLFKGGAPWNGEDECLATKLVSIRSSTASGLHLGLTPSQVVAILGRPTRRNKGELGYAVHARKKTSPAELKEWRKQQSQMSDREFTDNYEFYDLSVGIVLKFVNSKLTYISISKSATY